MRVISEKTHHLTENSSFFLKKRKILEAGITTQVGFTILFTKCTCVLCNNA